MGHATVRSFADLGAILNDVFNHAANSPKKEVAAASENGASATSNGANAVAPVFLCADDVRQGVTGHNVRYVLGFGLLGAAVGLAVAACVVGHGQGLMPPA